MPNGYFIYCHQNKLILSEDFRWLTTNIKQNILYYIYLCYFRRKLKMIDLVWKRRFCQFGGWFCNLYVWSTYKKYIQFVRHVRKRRRWFWNEYYVWPLVLFCVMFAMAAAAPDALWIDPSSHELANGHEGAIVSNGVTSFDTAVLKRPGRIPWRSSINVCLRFMSSLQLSIMQVCGCEYRHYAFCVENK